MALPHDIEADLDAFLDEVLGDEDIADFPALEKFKLMVEHITANMEDLDARLSAVE